MKRLGIKQGGDELYEKFQKIYDEAVSRADSYNLCINSSILGIEGTVKLIIQYVEDFEKKNNADILEK